jgi:hypothetical protein
LNLQQSPKHHGLVSRFFHGHHVLNLTEGHHPFDPSLWDPASILEDSKLSGVLGASSWVVWIHEELQLDPLILAHIGSSTLSIFFTLETKGMGGGGFSRTEGGKAAADLENLLMAIVLIEILQQKCDHSALC